MSTNFSDRILGPDTHANRPDAGDVSEGALYSCTDHSKVYRATSGSWTDWLSVVGGGTEEVITFVDAETANTGSGATSVVVTAPTHSTGDLLIAQLGNYADTGTITPPSDWTLIREDAQAAHPATASHLYWKIATGSEPANYTWSWVNSVQAAAGIASYSGGHATTPIDDDAGQGQTGTNVITAPEVTPTTGYRMLLFFGAIRQNRTVPVPSLMTERWDTNTGAQTGDSEVTIEMAEQIVGGDGVTGTGTRTATASGSTSFSSNVGQLVALVPATS